ncbi:MAG: hypothetical protein NTV09_11925 [Bacteroidetes bacterium]|nr:hypothetical protein [Bacteroidota bacterium]
MRFRFIVIQILILLNCTAAFASSHYYSRQNGAYNVASTWSTTSHTGSATGSPPCTCEPCAVSAGNVLDIAHALTIGCNVSYSGNPTVTILNGGSLTVTGSASITGSVDLTVNAGGTMNVSGNFNVTGNGTVIINGTLNIGGNLTITGSGSVCGTGSINLGGTITGTICNTIILPVTWLGVEAAYVNKSVNINWRTASEINNDYFIIERSEDGIRYQYIDRVKGAGNSTTLLEYNCVDEKPLSGINYYRIKQTNFDGTGEYSGTIAIFITENKSCVTVFPTIVTNNYVTMLFTGMKGKSVSVFLFDMSGKMLSHQVTFLSTASERMFYPVPDVYDNKYCVLNIISDGVFETRKIYITTE